MCSAIFTMDTNFEQRVCLKLCVANKNTCADSLNVLQKAYGKSALSKTLAYEWSEAFEEVKKVVKNLPHSNWPLKSLTDENIENGDGNGYGKLRPWTN